MIWCFWHSGAGNEKPKTGEVIDGKTTGGMY